MLMVEDWFKLFCDLEWSSTLAVSCSFLLQFTGRMKSEIRRNSPAVCGRVHGVVDRRVESGEWNGHEEIGGLQRVANVGWKDGCLLLVLLLRPPLAPAKYTRMPRFSSWWKI